MQPGMGGCSHYQPSTLESRYNLAVNENRNFTDEEQDNNTASLISEGYETGQLMTRTGRAGVFCGAALEHIRLLSPVLGKD